MTALCSCCEKWSALPLSGGKGAAPRASCEHCSAPLTAEELYLLCPDCGQWRLAEYDRCPLCSEIGQAGASLVEAAAEYATEAQRRKARDGSYYWQLYIDYQEAVPAPASPELALEVDGAVESSGAAESNGNGHGNGHAIHAAGDVALNGGGPAAAPTGHSTNGSSPAGIDLATAESMPLALFPDGEGSAYSTDTSQVEVSAGAYNEFDYELIQDPSRLAQVAELLSQEVVLGVDTETTGLDPHTSQLLLLQVSTPDKVYIVDCKRVLPLALKPLLEDSRVLKVAQNAKFEYEMLKEQAGITLSGMYDTMLSERILTAGLGREISLKLIAQKYIGAVLDKSVRESFYKLAANGDAYLAPEQLHYAARDAYIMIPVWQKQLPELKKLKLMQIAELEFRCIAAVGDMELAGVKIDEASWRKIIADVTVQRDRSAAELGEMLEPASMQATMFGVPSINLNSNVQLIEALSKLGVDLPDTMEATLVKYDHPAVKKLLEYRGHEKTLSAFGENVLGLVNPVTKRIHPDFNQHGADTGRFSCLVGETLVSVAGGLKRLDEVQAGDTVLTSYGPRRVLEAWCNGVRPVVRLTLSDGRHMRLTANHRVLSGDGSMWRAAGDLKAGDNAFLALNSVGMEQHDRPVKIEIDPGSYYAKSIATVPDSLSVQLCELAGLITADGTLRGNLKYRKGKRTRARYDQVRIAAGWGDDELISRINEYSTHLFGVPSKESKPHTCRVATISSTRVAEALARFGLEGTAHTKQVPQAVLSAPPIYQAAYLRGLFEGDGHLSESEIGLTSVNHGLLERVQIMLSRLGCYANIRTSNDKSGFASSTRYRLTIPGADNMARFMETVGFLSSRKNSKYTWHTGTLGAPTPIHISGAVLYRQAVAANLVGASRAGVKPFVPLYKSHAQSSESLKRLLDRWGDLLDRWGDLPELARAGDYISRGLHRVKVRSVEPDGEAPVYDLMVEEVGEFLANGIVVHNCTKPNVQQIPATSDFRKCFVAADGYKLVTCDYSQAELRILAELSQDPGFVEAFTSGADLHTLTASQMFGVPLEQVQKPQRNAAKAINFGLAYGMGPGGLAPRLGVTLDEAKELIARYFKAYPGVQKWLDKAAKDAVRNGYSITTLGRKRFYTMPDESLKHHNEDEWRRQVGAIERQGKNSPIQGCLHGDTRILVKGAGYVPIRDMCGKAVEVWDGERFVTAMVAASGKKQLVRLTLRGGHFIECSPDHKFWVACNNGYKWAWKWKTPAEIRAQNRVALNARPVEWPYALNIPPAVPGRAHNASRACLTNYRSKTSMGEWLGTVASDGSLGRNNTVSLLVAEHEETILDNLLATTSQWGHVNHSVRVTETQPARLHKLTIGAKSLHDQLVTVGIKERVPDFAWRDSSLLAAYLRGLFDGDGTVHPDGAILTFGQGDKHLKWAREVQEALLLLGIRSRINVYTNRHTGINLRVLKRDMPEFCTKIGFLNPEKQQRAVQITDAGRWERISPQYGIANLVESIEFTDEWVEMYDVVNSETGRFMANGMIVHNSNADMTKLALINLRNALKDWDARTVNTVHDEIVVEARADQAEEVMHIVEREMVRAGQAILKSVPIVAEAAVADYWSK